MRTAPRDGTVILVCEIIPRDEEPAIVLPAAFINSVGTMEAFWGVAVTSRLPTHLMGERQERADARGLPVGFRALAITPLCWQPLPKPESLATLRRRQASILARKYPKLKVAA